MYNDKNGGGFGKILKGLCRISVVAKWFISGIETSHGERVGYISRRRWQGC